MHQTFRFIAIFAFLCSAICASSQPSQKGKKKFNAVSVGNKMPDYTLINLINYPTKSAKVSDFRGKLLLFDFWGTGCSSCIASWPKLLSLQKEFEGKIQIILVNAFQNESVVRESFKKRKQIANIDMHLPSVCGDTVLGRQLFKHQSVPHVVWIDKEGYVRSISPGNTLNARNIQSMLNDEPITMKQKTEFHQNIDVAEPLFVNGNGGDGEQRITQSVLSKYIEGVGTMIEIRPADLTKCTTITINLNSIKNLYSFAYSNIQFGGVLTWLQDNRIIMQVKDPNKYERKVNGETIYDNLYAYQLISPPTTRERLQEMMQMDLKKYFGLNVNWEKRIVKCLVLTAADTSLVYYKSGREIFDIDENKGVIRLNDVPINRLFHWLEYVIGYRSFSYPLIDETGLKGKLGGIDIEADIKDYQSLNKALQKYNMTLTLQEREISMLVINEPEGYKFPFDNEINKLAEKPD